MRGILTSLVTALALAAAGPAAAAPATITDFPIAGAGEHRPVFMTAAPNGTLWFVDQGGLGAVRQVALDGQALESIPGKMYSGPTWDLGFDLNGYLFWGGWSTNADTGHANNSYFSRSPSGAQGNGPTFFDGPDKSTYAIGFTSTGGLRWTFQSTAGARVCRVNSATLASCAAPGTNGRLTDLPVDAAGRMWALDPDGAAAFRGDADATSFARFGLPAGSNPGRAALGPDGNLWVAGFGTGLGGSNTTNQIIKLSPDGVPTSFMLPPGTGPNEIVLGPDGALWFTQNIANSIGRITTSGAYRSFTVPTAAAGPYGLAVGADRNLWFTENKAGRVGRLVPGDDVNAGATQLTPALGAGADKTKPVLGSFGFSRTTFRAAGSGASVSDKRKKRKKVATGTKVSFSLSEPGSVRFTVERKSVGRRVKKGCVAPKRSNRRKKRCTRYVAVRGSFTVAGRAGRNSFTFRGRISRKRLRAGTYRLTGKATDSAKNVSAPREKAFKIVK